MNKRTARSRWLSPQNADRRSALITAVRSNRTSANHLLDNTGCTEEGLIDLRGLSFETGLELEKARFHDVDLSYSDFGHGIFRQCTFENVRFREIDSRQWNERGCQFTDVDFSGANLRDAAIGIDGSTYIRVSFRKVDFSGASFFRPQFIDCDFCDARLKDVDFFASNFVNCKFSGRLEGVWFRRYYPLPQYERQMGKAVPNQMRNVDFSEAELWGVTFTGGLDLSHVVLPKDGSHILLRHFDAALTRVKEDMDTLSLWSVEEKKQVMISIESFLVHAKNQPMWILNKKEMLAELGEEIGESFVALLVKFDVG